MGTEVLDHDPDLEEEPIKKPSPNWRNKYWSDIQMVFSTRTVGPGFWYGRDLWPSKEIAEEKASVFLEQMHKWLGQYSFTMTYEGAVQEGSEE